MYTPQLRAGIRLLAHRWTGLLKWPRLTGAWPGGHRTTSMAGTSGMAIGWRRNRASTEPELPPRPADVVIEQPTATPPSPQETLLTVYGNIPIHIWSSVHQRPFWGLWRDDARKGFHDHNDRKTADCPLRCPQLHLGVARPTFDLVARFRPGFSLRRCLTVTLGRASVTPGRRRFGRF